MNKKLPLTLTKQQLCAALGLYSHNHRSGNTRYYTDKLRKHYLTDDVLMQLNIAPGVFDRRGVYVFDALKTKKLFELIEELRELEF